MRRRFMINNSRVEELPYLTIEALEDGLIVKFSSACLYSTDGETWKSLSADKNTSAINSGKRIYFKGNLTPSTSEGVGIFTVNKNFNLSGNVMSMLFGDEAESNLDLTNYAYAFKYLFKDCSTLISVSDAFLPATTLQSYCYYAMFKNCTSLIKTPKLPSMNLKSHCYRDMFAGCSSLVEAPELPALKLAGSCYNQMFYNCTSLVKAPVLPALTLENACYYAMFYQCTKLNYIKALFLTAPSNTYTNAWVYKVASSGTFVKNNFATWSNVGISGVPTGWTVVADGGDAYVDLGLPSGLKWATCNVGATSSTQIGSYFSWGETLTKTVYNSSTSSTYGVEIQDISGNSQYDAATANLGESWRIPTHEEVVELITNCTATTVTVGSAKICALSGPNGNYLYLPLSGYLRESTKYLVNLYGYYYTSTPYSKYYAYRLRVDLLSPQTDYSGKDDGFNIRPVYVENG